MSSEEKPWQNEEVLREMYHEQRMSMQEIADHFGDLTFGGIKYWMDKHGIERRSRSESTKLRWEKYHLKPHTETGYGYEVIQHEYGDGYARVYMHRLLAVAEFGFDEVKDKVVHHKNGLSWDNRPDNIELMTAAEHARHHK